jgi:Glucosidase II beta subunit-like protein
LRNIQTIRLVAMLFFGVLLLLCSVTLIQKAFARDVDEFFHNLFTDHGDFDPLILDPYHIYGAPFGGYSRSAQNHLASLPLHLPDVLEDEGAFATSMVMSYYFEVRDEDGRLFACRLYHEDELAPVSLHDSMFNPPILRSGAAMENNKQNGKSQSMTDPGVPETPSKFLKDGNLKHIDSSTSSNSVRRQYGSAPLGESVVHGNDEKKSISNAKVADKIEKSMRDYEDHLFYVLDRMQDLSSVCGQLHKGWWSYEWCYDESITQFHIDYDTERNTIQVEQIIELGYFKSRSVLLDLDILPPNEYAENMQELARIVDFHDNGSVCDETGGARSTFVNIVCCSEKIVQNLKGMLHKGGHPISANVAALIDVEEDPDVLCSYNVTVCTPLLCVSVDPGAAEVKREQRKLTSTDELVPKENESIREMLDRVLTLLCLQSDAGGWWTYEICYKNSIRQFHESVGAKRNSAGVKILSKVVESEHILGRYDASTEKLSVLDDEEWKLVVNVTSSDSGAGNVFGDGNGAYYEIEYIGGDICDHSDVTDAAIVAGSAARGDGGVERTSSVRFYCGESYDISVYEDSTCHYIVQVKVPALCKHRLFRAPLAKKQVVKCIPADD